jgi:hypothetical protein
VLSLYREHVHPEFQWTNFSLEEQDKILAGACVLCVRACVRVCASVSHCQLLEEQDKILAGVFVCVRACVRACACVCLCACVRACVRV